MYLARRTLHFVWQLWRALALQWKRWDGNDRLLLVFLLYWNDRGVRNLFFNYMRGKQKPFHQVKIWKCRSRLLLHNDILTWWNGFLFRNIINILSADVSPTKKGRIINRHTNNCNIFCCILDIFVTVFFFVCALSFFCCVLWVTHTLEQKTKQSRNCPIRKRKYCTN